MATIDLGMVTAYAYAVAGGYEGTEAEFEELLGNIADDLGQIENLQVIATTLAEGSSATASYADGVLTLGIPRGDTGATGATGPTGPQGETGNGIASITLTSTSGAVHTYTITFTDGTTTTFDVTDGEVTSESLAQTLEEYARVDGAYEGMTVGNAEQLVSTVMVEDSEPYQFRTSGGSADIGNREYDEIVGGTVARNQLARTTQIRPNSQVVSDKGINYTKNDDGSFTLSGTANETGNADFYFTLNEYASIVSGHRYVTDGSTRLYTNVSGSGAMYTATSDGYTKAWIRIAVTQGTNYNVKIYPMVFDLTQLFGSTIADYIYSLETATAGAGVAFFRKFFPNDYYEYNAGELKSVEGLTSHDTVGFNQFDENNLTVGYRLGTSDGTPVVDANSICSTNFIPCLPNTVYHLHCGDTSKSQYVYIFLYDAEQNFVDYWSFTVIGERNITTPSNVAYFKVSMYGYGTTYNNDICINLSWSGYRNGEYEPYVKHTYPLDSSLTLRGIPKLTADGTMYYDGDTYESDGTVTRRYGIVDMGTLNWTAFSTNIFRVDISGKKNASSASAVDNIICSKYQAVAGNDVVDQSADKAIGSSVSNGRVFVRDTAYTDATAFKNSLSGQYLVYELATPTTETAEPFASPQIVDDFGTEEYVTTSIVPVGHNTEYPSNLRDKLQHLPDLADSDGYYLIQQSDNDMSLIAFHIPRATGLADGTYTLKATVSNGTPTYTWEAE